MADAPAAAGIQARYEQARERLGAHQQLPAAELLKRFPPPPPLAMSPSAPPRLALDKCEFYADFAASPDEVNAQRAAAREAAEKTHGAAAVQHVLSSSRHHEWKKARQFDFRLHEQEAQRLAQHGVAVSQRLAAASFAEAYYQLYSDDLPVFVTADSILHAWHRSFDSVLVDIEMLECMPALEDILRQASAKCHELFHLSHGSNATQVQVLLDVDLFLTVALSLLLGEESSGLPRNTARVSALWRSIEMQRSATIQLFAGSREVDFSLFKPRGHYSRTKKLMKYFQAMMWLGTIDFRVAGKNGADPNSELHQLQCAVVLVALLRETSRMERLDELDELISSLVADGGVGADSLTPTQLYTLLPTSLGIAGLLDTYVRDGDAPPPALLALQQEIVRKRLGAQLISGHAHVANESSRSPTELPTSFAFFGQRFVWSSFIFSRLVYDQIVHEETKVARRLPSAVDVAFALFGSNAAGAIAAKRMDASKGNEKNQADGEASAFVPLRDGIPFASNLIALRDTIDREFAASPSSEASANDESISTLWVRALRELSKPSASRASVFQSSVWQLRQLNAQIASFTQLRHDSVLYATQSYTISTACEYAAGFVDPYPPFYASMKNMAERMGLIIQKLQSPPQNSALRYTGAHFFLKFAATMTTLEEIALCQAHKQPLKEEQTQFIKTVMEERFGSGSTRYAGWYPSLFYAEREDSGKREVLVADVHTDVPSVEHGDPGGVLHLGVGDVRFGFFVVDDVMYSGPVFSSYEFITPINERLSDEEFQARLDEKSAAPSPSDWALSSFLC